MNRTELEREVAAAHAACVACKKPIWGSLSDAERVAVVDGVAAYRTVASGDGIIPRIICAACEAKQAKELEAKEHGEQVDKWIREGGFPRNARRYQEPLSELMTQNLAAWEIARGWKPANGSLYVHGPEGVGKTALGFYVLLRGAETFRLRPAVVRSVELEHRPRDDRALRWVAGIRRAGIVLLDDLSVPRFTTRGLERIWDILDARHNSGRATIITANCSVAALHDRFRNADPENAALATAILRRMRPCLEIQMGGESARTRLEYGTEQDARTPL